MRHENSVKVKTFLFITIVVGVLMLLLWSIPVKNEIQGDMVKVHFALGRVLKIDVSESIFSAVPDNASNHLIRTNGTQIGKIQSGNFKNTRTGEKFLFYTTGKGTRVYFEATGKKYIMDFPEDIIKKLDEKE